MKEKELPDWVIRYCEQFVPPDYKPFIPRVLRTIYAYEPALQFTDPKVREGILRAAVDLSHRPDRAPDGQAADKIEFSPDNFIRSDEAFKSIRPELEHLRKRIFGRAEPPYPNGGAAPRKLVAKLLGPTAQLDETTCFTQASLLSFILMGVKPIASAYRIRAEVTLPPPETEPIRITPALLNQRRVQSAELKLYRPLSDRELLALLKELKKRMKPARKKLTQRHYRLYLFFEEYGLPPLTGKMQFWTDALAEWKRRYPDDEISSYLSLRIAWLRLQALLRRP